MQSVDLASLIAAAARLQTQWRSMGMRFCFIGGLAVQRWGEPRLTNDVDATVWTEFGNERPVVDRLLQNLTGRIERADQFAIANRVLLAQDSSGVDIDVSLAAFPFESDLIERASEQSFGGIELRLCGPSDLVILKGFANRPRDWQDIRSVLIRSGSELDWDLIDRELKLLSDLKEEPEILDRLETLRSEFPPSH